MRVVHIKNYRSKFSIAEQKETRKKAAEKAAETNKNKMDKDAARANNKLQYTPENRKSPVKRAEEIIGKERLKEIVMCDGIAWQLDGKPTSLNLVMREANRILLKIGCEQIKDNPAWVI